jgi:hypothetical protein
VQTMPALPKIPLRCTMQLCMRNGNQLEQIQTLTTEHDLPCYIRATFQMLVQEILSLCRLQQKGRRTQARLTSKVLQCPASVASTARRTKWARRSGHEMELIHIKTQELSRSEWWTIEEICQNNITILVHVDAIPMD